MFEIQARWRSAAQELKHSRRFFSPQARVLFDDLFRDVDGMRVGGRSSEPVSYDLAEGTTVYRARICRKVEDVEKCFSSPGSEVGPPPPELARGGRMNAEGIVVFYGAMDEATCLAEIRPAKGTQSACVAWKTTRPLRIIDFTRLDRAYSPKVLSYFQPDFEAEVKRGKFLRTLHGLISQPVAPGHEADYVLTQTMAEYLSHVHERPFEGVMFASAQHEGGLNLVLFPDPDLLVGDLSAQFGVEPVPDSVKWIQTKTVIYEHDEVNASFDSESGKLKWIDYDDYDDFEP